MGEKKEETVVLRYAKIDGTTYLLEDDVLKFLKEKGIKLKLTTK
jgi:hypothetical protein